MFLLNGKKLRPDRLQVQQHNRFAFIINAILDFYGGLARFEAKKK